MSFAIVSAVVTAGIGIYKAIDGAKQARDAKEEAEIFSVGVDAFESSK